MPTDPTPLSTFTIKAEQLPALNYLDHKHPRPRKLVWINRGTNQELRPTSVAMLLRTLFRGLNTPSVVRLHQSSGLRASFRTDKERDGFARAFANALRRQEEDRQHLIIAIFEDRQTTVQAVAALKAAGIPERAISVMWRASKFLDVNYRWREGHSPLSVVGAVAGGGVAGAMFGMVVFLVPGVGLVAAGGLLAASTLASVATFGGIIGGTGGAIARMLTDHDVDGVAAKHYEAEVQRGKVFVSVDVRSAPGGNGEALEILARHKGRAAMAI